MCVRVQEILGVREREREEMKRVMREERESQWGTTLTSNTSRLTLHPSSQWHIVSVKSQKPISKSKRSSGGLERGGNTAPLSEYKADVKNQPQNSVLILQIIAACLKGSKLKGAVPYRITWSKTLHSICTGQGLMAELNLCCGSTYDGCLYAVLNMEKENQTDRHHLSALPHILHIALNSSLL